MAEAIINHRLGERWEAFSAGTQPSGYVHPSALLVLEEIGIQHAGRSKSVTEFQGVAFDLVITVCDSAAEQCPIWLGNGERMHISFPDPAKVTGAPDAVLSAFRAVRDEILNRIPPAFNTSER
jgi:arsenate reductase